MDKNEGFAGSVVSPGGFIFGVQGWTWGEPRPKSITFFLDGTATVADQHGRPIKGTMVGNKEVKFATSPPKSDGSDRELRVAAFATHEQVVTALAAERIDWQTLTCAGWPQLPYEQLKQVKEVPATPKEELQKIRNSTLRKDALRVRQEYDLARAKEMEVLDEGSTPPPAQPAAPPKP